MLNHTVVICLLTLVSVGSIFLFKGMEWSDKHDLVLCQEVLVMEPYQHPYRSKERGAVWNQITVNLSGLDHPKFKVNRRSIRDRLIMTFLITKLKAKIRHKKNATGNTCEETELNQALEEITTGEVYEKKEEGAAREEHRQSAMERLGQTVKRHFEYFDHSHFLCFNGKLVVDSKRAINSQIFSP